MTGKLLYPRVKVPAKTDDWIWLETEFFNRNVKRKSNLLWLNSIWRLKTSTHECLIIYNDGVFEIPWFFTRSSILAILALNTLRPGQDGHHLVNDTFKYKLVNENVLISIKNSFKFVPKGSINNIPALVQIMAWCRPGDKPLSEPMMVRLPMHIWVIQSQWVKRRLLE